jgi:hypothetical protein
MNMTKNLTAARTDAYRLLLKTYEVLYKVEHQLSDNEARLLIDIAQGIELLEEKLNDDEEEQ